MSKDVCDKQGIFMHSSAMFWYVVYVIFIWQIFLPAVHYT